MELITFLVGAVQSIGFPQVISLGLMVILWQQTRVLQGIRACLDQIHAVLRGGSKTDEQHYQADPSLRASRDFRAG